MFPLLPPQEQGIPIVSIVLTSHECTCDDPASVAGMCCCWRGPRAASLGFVSVTEPDELAVCFVLGDRRDHLKFLECKLTYFYINKKTE